MHSELLLPTRDLGEKQEEWQANQLQQITLCGLGDYLEIGHRHFRHFWWQIEYHPSIQFPITIPVQVTVSCSPAPSVCQTCKQSVSALRSPPTGQTYHTFQSAQFFTNFVPFNTNRILISEHTFLICSHCKPDGTCGADERPELIVV